MNVQWVPVLVTKTLIAATVTVLTAVLVKKDSQEMAQRVQVSCSGRDFWECSIEFIFRYETPTIFFLWDLDIDECSTQSSLVTKMPIAPTMKVLIAVRVNGDSVGMV